MPVLSPISTVALQPCCLPGDTDSCGFDLTSLLRHHVACQGPAPAGSRDSACVDVPFASDSLPGCRRMDGNCGFLLPGVGCMLAQ
jgi:hypothetical protein